MNEPAGKAPDFPRCLHTFESVILHAQSRWCRSARMPSGMQALYPFDRSSRASRQRESMVAPRYRSDPSLDAEPFSLPTREQAKTVIEPVSLRLPFRASAPAIGGE